MHLVEEIDSHTELARRLLARINDLREKPKNFIPVLRRQLDRYRESVYYLQEDGQYKKTKEGRKAV